MSDDITNAPASDNSRRVTSGLRPDSPAGNWPNITVPGHNPQTAVLLILRVVATVAVAGAFVYLCWLMSYSDSPTSLILAGPVLSLRGYYFSDRLFGFAMTAVQVPCIFAVGVWPNKATVVVFVVGCAVWVAEGAVLWASGQ